MSFNSRKFIRTGVRAYIHIRKSFKTLIVKKMLLRESLNKQTNILQ
jgi:hypothetical protein